MALHAAGKWATCVLRTDEENCQSMKTAPELTTAILFFIQYPLVALRSGARRINAITARPGTKLAMIDLIRL